MPASIYAVGSRLRAKSVCMLLQPGLLCRACRAVLALAWSQRIGAALFVRSNMAWAASIVGCRNGWRCHLQPNALCYVHRRPQICCCLCRAVTVQSLHLCRTCGCAFPAATLPTSCACPMPEPTHPAAALLDLLLLLIPHASNCWPCCCCLQALVYSVGRPDPWPTVVGYHELFHLLVAAAALMHYTAVYRVVRAQ